MKFKLNCQNSQKRTFVKWNTKAVQGRCGTWY